MIEDESGEHNPTVYNMINEFEHENDEMDAIIDEIHESNYLEDEIPMKIESMNDNFNDN